MHIVSGALACSLIFLPLSGNAQTPRVPTRAEAIQALSDSDWVRLAGGTFGRLEGIVLAHTATDLVLSVEARPSRIPATNIDTLWARGKATKTGALLGALLGAGIGIVVATQAVEEGETPGTEWIGAFGVGGALVGGSLGALIGSAFPRWNRRYPR
jgi:hypothetical protein